MTGLDKDQLIAIIERLTGVKLSHWGGPGTKKAMSREVAEALLTVLPELLAANNEKLANDLRQELGPRERP